MKVFLAFTFSDFDIDGQGTISNTRKYKKKCIKVCLAGTPSQYQSSLLFLE
jgi:hypothetical protein